MKIRGFFFYLLAISLFIPSLASANETYAQAVDSAILHSTSPTSTWLPASSPAGPIVLIDHAYDATYGLKYDSSNELIVRTDTKQKFWVTTSSSTKAPGQSYKIVGSLADGRGAFVTTGNDLTNFFDTNLGTKTGSDATRLLERGLGINDDGSHDAVVEYAVADINNNLIRPTKYIKNTSYDTSVPANYADSADFQSKPGGMDATTYTDFKTFYAAFKNNAYKVGTSDAFPFTQFGYTYFWGNDSGASLTNILGMSEFVIMPDQDFSGTDLGKPYGTVKTYGIYPTQSYIYTRNDGTSLSTAAGSQYGNGFASFQVSGSCDTVWAGHRFQYLTKRQADGVTNQVIINSGATVSGGQGLLIWSRNYAVTNNGTISGATTDKFGITGTSNIAVLFEGNTTAYSAEVPPPSGATDVNTLTNTGTISSPGIAIEADAGDTNITNSSNGVISGDTYAILTADGKDTVIFDGGNITGSIDLGAGTSDLLNVRGNDGKVTLNFFLDRDTRTSAQIAHAETVTFVDNKATLAVDAQTGSPNIRNNDSFLIVDATTLNADPTKITVENDPTLPMITFAAGKAANQLYLTATRNDSYYVNNSPNSSLGGTLDALAENGSSDMADIIGALDDTGNANNALQLEPNASAPVVNASIETLNNFGNTFSMQMARADNGGHDVLAYSMEGGRRKRVPASRIMNLLAYNSDSVLENSFYRPQNWEVFATGFGVLNSQNDKGDSTGYDSGGGGTQFGFYRGLNDTLKLGVLGGYMFDSIKLNGDSGAQNINSLRVGPCGKWLNNDFYTTGALTYGWHAVKANRKINLGVIQRQADADYNMDDISPYGEIGYIFHICKGFEIVPNMSLQYDWMFSEGYDESGAGSADLSVKSFGSNSLISVIGARLNGSIDCGSVSFLPEFSVGWQHEYLDRANSVKAEFANESAGTFTTNANVFDRSSVKVGVAASFLYGKRRNALTFQYSAGISDSATNQVFGITSRFYF